MSSRDDPGSAGLTNALRDGKDQLLRVLQQMSDRDAEVGGYGQHPSRSPDDPRPFGPGVVVICGTARLPASLGKGGEGAMLAVEVALDRQQEKFVGANCSGVGVLGQRLLAEVLCDQELSQGLTTAILAVEERYFGENKRAFIAALEDVRRRYGQNLKSPLQGQAGLDPSTPESFLSGYVPTNGDETLRKLEVIDAVRAEDTLTMRNMLGVITGLASAMKKGLPRDSSLVRDLEEMVAAANRCALLAQTDRSAQEQEDSGCRSWTPLEDVVRDLPVETRKSLRLSRETSGEALCVFAPQDGLRRAVMELIGNARAAAGTDSPIGVAMGSVVISSANAKAEGLAPGEYVQIRVSDDGPGMPEALVEKAFEPLFTTRSSGNASGLGLSRVYAFARCHGGSVSVASQEGHGTDIFLVLPRAPAESSEAELTRATGSTREAVTVLLVDDEKAVQAMGSRLLEGLGCRVLLAGNGEEGVAVFRQHHSEVAAVILDIAMPVMAGGDCLKQIRTIDREVPVIVSTGFSRQQDRERLRGWGADAFLDKPFEIEGLQSVLSQVIGKHAAKL